MKNVISVVDNYSLINDFYPDDLPQDWRLDYYLNEFETLFINENIIKIFEENDEEINELLEERESPLSVVIEDKASAAVINQKTPLIIDYLIPNKVTNKHSIASPNEQGVDDLDIILIKFSQFENLKELSQFCQTSISKNNTTQTILILQAPCTIKQIKDLEILLNLIF